MKQTKKILMAMSVILLLMSCAGKAEKKATEQETEGVVSRLYDVRAAQPNSKTPQNAVLQYEIPRNMRAATGIVLKRKGYTAMYDVDTKTPIWVAWHLTKARTYGNAKRNREMFGEDMEVPKPRATDNDYYHSGYDRGHMCPAGDNKWDMEALKQTFLFTNICPQNHNLNKYEWNDVEMMCREWAQRYGSVDVVCGPIYAKHEVPRTIGKNKVKVPDAFFKVVLCRESGAKAIGFVYQNVGKKQNMYDAIRTVDEIEELTGLDFFPLLRDDIENKIEAEANLSAWPKVELKRH